MLIAQSGSSYASSGRHSRTLNNVCTHESWRGESARSSQRGHDRCGILLPCGALGIGRSRYSVRSAAGLKFAPDCLNSSRTLLLPLSSPRSRLYYSVSPPARAGWSTSAHGPRGRNFSEFGGCPKLTHTQSAWIAKILTPGSSLLPAIPSHHTCHGIATQAFGRLCSPHWRARPREWWSLKEYPRPARPEHSSRRCGGSCRGRLT